MPDEKHDLIEFQNASLKYTRWKGESKILLCFHGFGQDRFAYETIHQSLTGTYTVYSFDAFFHGESKWNRKQESFYPKDWFNFMELFLEKESIKEFEVMGYSMGGKYAMITAQLFPLKIRHVHLLAPDGISTHFSYRFSTYPIVFKRLLKTQIKNPRVFNRLVKLVKATKWMDNYTLRFAETQMDTEFKRAQVYYSWVVLRHFIPDLKKLASQINTHQTTLTFYLGKHDKVISRKEVSRLVNLLDNPEIIEIDSGHSKLIDNLSQFFYRKSS